MVLNPFVPLLRIDAGVLRHTGVEGKDMGRTGSPHAFEKIGQSARRGGSSATRDGITCLPAAIIQVESVETPRDFAAWRRLCGMA